MVAIYAELLRFVYGEHSENICRAPSTYLGTCQPQGTGRKWGAPWWMEL